MIDIHSHIIYRIDDGASSKEESIQMAREAERAGFTHIIATPHFNIENNSIEDIRNRYTELKGYIEENNIDIKLHMGCEAFINHDIDKLVMQKKIPSLNDSKYLLFELPLKSRIIYLERIIENLVRAGIMPVIAHPERYSYINDKVKFFEPLIRKGLLLQCNYGSLTGYYGREAKKDIIKLIKNDMVFFFATDCHRRNSMYTRMNEFIPELNKIAGNQKVKELTLYNPMKILSGDI